MVNQVARSTQLVWLTILRAEPSHSEQEYEFYPYTIFAFD